MPVQVPNFQRIGFDEANPLMTGFSKGVQNSYLPMEKQQDLQKALYDNMTRAAQVPYAPEMAEYDRDIKLAQRNAAPLSASLNNLTPQALVTLLASGHLGDFLKNTGQGWAQVGSQTGHNTQGRPGYAPPPANARPIHTENESQQVGNSQPKSAADRFYEPISKFFNLPNNNNPTSSGTSIKLKSGKTAVLNPQTGAWHYAE